VGRQKGIEVENLVREFRKGPRAVDGIDLRVEPGEVYGFLGPNGAGKSTTVLMLTTLLPPTSGTATVAGYDIVHEGPQVRASIGAALQEAALDPFLTGREHLRLQAALHGLSRKERKRRGQELLERVGLEDAADRKVRGYSGGMKRRLDLALALVHGPQILFLDEPTTGLDPQARHLLWDRLYRLKQRGVTLVLTTHYMDEAEQLCDRLVVMDKAKIVAEGSPRSLIERYSTREVTELRFKPGERETLDGQLEGLAERVEQLPDRVLLYADDGEAAAAAAHARGLQPETVLVRRSSLEDVFLRLTGRSLVD
jgi:lipooligosaccharide transport system ATP-binding protein